jgi:hypothetical protein
LRKYKGVAWDQSPLFKKLYEEEYGQFGGEPYGALVADYYFDHSNTDVDLLMQMGKISAAAHAPFIAAADPSVMLMESWQELANPRDLTKIFQTPEHAAWRSLRESEDSRYIGLAMPRFLARAPYGAKTSPVEEFDFEEDTAGSDSKKYAWANAAYAMAVNINRSFKVYGWCSRIRGIESGGSVENLPVHAFPTDDGGVDMKCPTEIAISDRREAELAKNGFMPLVHKKNSDFAAFIGAQSLNKPQEYEDPDATANANLATRLQPLRPLPEMHCARQDRQLQGKGRHATVVAKLDSPVRGRRSHPLDRGNQGAPTARCRGSHRRGSGRQPWLLHVQVLPASALPARRADGVVATGFETAVREGCLIFPASNTFVRTHMRSDTWQ